MRCTLTFDGVPVAGSPTWSARRGAAGLLFTVPTRVGAVEGAMEAAPAALPLRRCTRGFCEAASRVKHECVRDRRVLHLLIVRERDAAQASVRARPSASDSAAQGVIRWTGGAKLNVGLARRP